MFIAEAEGLEELDRAGAIRVPHVLDKGRAGAAAFLVLEWLELAGGHAGADGSLGRRLAAQHRFTADEHGWCRDNSIGTTPQLNTRSDDWAAFFRDCRLRYQLELARRNGLPSSVDSALSALIDAVPSLLAGHLPQPALLHGDLWSGNRSALADGTPVVFDPAVYFGDRETDLAMTRLFGGFGPEFYAAYADELPLPAGWEWRTDLYNLYHLLNHFNLFGSGYLGSVVSTVARLERALR